MGMVESTLHLPSELLWQLLQQLLLLLHEPRPLMLCCRMLLGQGIYCCPCSISAQGFAHAKQDSGHESIADESIASKVHTPCF